MPTRFPIALLLWVCLGSFSVAAAFAQPADLLVKNGKVVTVDQNFSIARAVAIRQGRIVAVGSNDQVQPLVGEGTRVIDAQQRTVIPGLIESHVHATDAARNEVTHPFVQLTSIAEIQDWLRERAKLTPAGEWILLPRVDITRIRERRVPTPTELEQAAPNHPALFNWQYAERQIQVLNALALKAAGITSQTQPPRGGKIHLDDKGHPTGVIENSNVLTAKFTTPPQVSEEAYLSSLERLLKLYNAQGITSINERLTNLEGHRGFERLRDQGRLTVRVTSTFDLVTDGTREGTEQAVRQFPFKTGDGDDWVKAGPFKLTVDGGVLYGTAFLRQPYGPQSFSLYGFSDPQYRGDLRIPLDHLKNIFRVVHESGWQMSSHVTGDAGVDAVLDALEATDSVIPIRNRRYNLIHAYFPTKETAERAARLGVAVDTQPAWYYKDGDALADALGAHRLEKFIGLKVWRDAGVKVGINSDHVYGFGPKTSFNPYDPFLTMNVAVSRKTESGLIIGPDQKVSREDALRMMTIEAAWLSFDEKKLGSLEVGKLGDLAILSDDLLTCNEDRIKDIRAVTTIVGGKVVYEDPGAGVKTSWRRLPVSAVKVD